MFVAGFHKLKPGPIPVCLPPKDQLLQKKVACSNCHTCCPKMTLGSCGHMFCERCLLGYPGHPDHSLTLCILCGRPVTTTAVSVEESFLSHLNCHCPSCNSVCTIKGLRDHFYQCAARSTSNSTTPTYTATYVGYHEVHLNATTTTPNAWVLTSTTTDPRLGHLEHRVQELQQQQQQRPRSIFPASYTLVFSFSGEVGNSRIYRTPTIFLDGIGFNLTTCDDRDDITLHFLSVDSTHRASNPNLSWKMWFWHNGREVTVDARLQCPAWTSIGTFFNDGDQKCDTVALVTVTSADVTM